MDCVGNRCRRRYDRHLADTTDANWMTRIRHFNEDRLNHRHIQCRGHAVVKESRIPQSSLFVIVVLFIESPPSALRHGSLNLSFDIAGMHGFTNVLRCGIAQHIDLSSLWINGNVNYVCGEGSTHAAKDDRSLDLNWTV